MQPHSASLPLLIGIFGYKEFQDYYIAVRSISDLVKEAEKLKNQNYYNQWAEKIMKPAEIYHIDNVAKLYKQLK